MWSHSMHVQWTPEASHAELVTGRVLSNVDDKKPDYYLLRDMKVVSFIEAKRP
jgi:hypothetical protein